MMVFAQVSLSDDDGVNKENPRLLRTPRRQADVHEADLPEGLRPGRQGRIVTKKLPSELGSKTRRQVLAEYVVTHDNFAKAYVNRIWGHLFGRGLNKEPSIDDFGSHNEVVHPELLEKTRLRLRGSTAYDSKALLEAICTSDVYSLSHVANKDYADEKYNPYFARMPLEGALARSAPHFTGASHEGRRRRRR